jgi:hypothetical protein
MIGDFLLSNSIPFDGDKGITLDAVVAIKLFEGDTEGIRTEGEGFKARLHEMNADVGADSAVLKPHWHDVLIKLYK